MLKQKDIEQAKKLFKEWDNKNKWDKPAKAFLEHTKKKAKETLELAVYLMDKLKNTDELKNNEATTMWVITKSYYSMFFLAEYLLGLDGKKLPDGTKDTHRIIYLAFLFYYLIKGSELEMKSSAKPTTSRMSKALSLFKELQDETMELSRVQQKVRDLDKQREQRTKFTYRMNISAEIQEAEKSMKKAKEFRELIEEYIKARNI